MHNIRLLLCSVLAACGDIAAPEAALDAGNGVDAVASGDGPAVMRCGSLPATCGPGRDMPCCASSVVSGGMFYRSYDTAADVASPDMRWPATVSDFRLDKYEVTVARFREFVAAGQGTQATPPPAGAGAHAQIANSGWDPSWNGSLAADTRALLAGIKCEATYRTWTDTPAANESRPMNCINWYEAMAFCAWDGGYLPTEAEWNYAASGGNLHRSYPWSSPPTSLTIDETRLSYYIDATKECYGDGVTGCALTDLLVVGSKPAGDGVWGQSDLAGNVWEWVLDWHATPYPTPCTDCANLTPATNRSLRGGSFGNTAPWHRTSPRGNLVAPTRDSGVGVRCARSAP